MAGPAGIFTGINGINFTDFISLIINLVKDSDDNVDIRWDNFTDTGAVNVSNSIGRCNVVCH
jgi:hypothetical protein